MKKFLNEKDMSGQYLKVLQGITGVNLKIFNDTNESDFQTFKIPIIPIEKMIKENFEEAIEHIINHTNYDNYVNSIEISVKKYNRPLHLINSGLQESNEELGNKVKCILLKNYLHETLDLNEYYFTLSSADFRAFNKSGQYSIKAEISLRDLEGNVVKNSISFMMNSKEEKHNHFSFNLISDTEFPFWNEMVRIILPKVNIEEYFICILFKKYFEKNNVIRLKDKNDSAWAVVHFIKPETQSMNTGDIKIAYFKMKLKNQVVMKPTDDGSDGDKDFIRMIGGVNPQHQDTNKDFINVSSRIFSTRHSENNNISTLINAQKGSTKITDEMLKQVSYADLSELVNFYGKLIKLGISIFESHLSAESYKSYFAYMTAIIGMSKYLDNSELMKIGEKFMNSETNITFVTKFNDRNIKFFNDMKSAKYEIKQLIGSMMDCFVPIIRIFKPSYLNSNFEAEMNTFRELIKTFFVHFNAIVKECMGDSTAYILKYIVICPDLVMNLSGILSSEELNEFIKSILILEELIKCDNQKQNTTNYLCKIVENYSNTFLSIVSTKNQQLIELSGPTIIKRVLKISSAISVNESTLDLYISIIEILEYWQLNHGKPIEGLNFLPILESIILLCVDDINTDYWNVKILRNMIVFFSLIKIASDDIFFEFFKNDQESKYENSTNILIIFEYYMQTSNESKMSIFLMEQSSEIIYKVMSNMVSFIKNVGKKEEDELSLISSIFSTSLNIIKALCEEGNSYIILDLLENYTNTKNNLSNHTNVLYSAFILEPKFKSIIYEEVSALLSLILSQKLTQKLFNIVYDFFIECCETEEDIKKLMSNMYSYIEKNIDVMGARANKIKFILIKIFEKMELRGDKSEVKTKLHMKLKELERLVDVITGFLLEKDEQYNPVFKLIRYQSIMKISGELNLTDFTMCMMLRVKEENEKIKCLSEASTIIRLIISPENNFSSIKKLINITSKQEEQLLTAVDYDEKCNNYFYAIKNCKLLVSYYEKDGYPCDKISKTYKKMADLSNELSNFNKNSMTFYNVTFYGKKFPKFLINKSYIFYMGQNIKLGDAISFFQSHIYFAKITNQAPKTEKLADDENFIHLLAAKPKKSKKKNVKVLDMGNKISYDQKEKKFQSIETKSSKVDGKTVITVFQLTFKTDFELPSYFSMAEVKERKTREMSDADQSISNFSTSIEDTNLAIQTYLKEPATFKMLIMKLQGNMVAKVNGGIDLVIDKYFKEKYFENKKKEAHKLPKLKQLLIEFMDSNAEAISLAQKNLPPEQAPLFQEIKKSYNDTRDNLKKYNLTCNPLTDDGGQTLNTGISAAEKSSSPKYVTIFRKKPLKSAR